MSNSLEELRDKINGAGDLRSVVRTMKSVAAANIGQYEKSVRSLADYNRTVELGLSVCFRKNGAAPILPARDKKVASRVDAIVFGSDQGLVGQFNDVIVDFAKKTISGSPSNLKVWAVGERVHARLANTGLPPAGIFSLPHSIKGITPLIGKILQKGETPLGSDEITELHLFYNRPTSGASYEPVHQQLLPLDEKWRKKMTGLKWAGGNLPEMIGDDLTTLRALIREYLFVSLFRACAESLASENASRLAAMQRADKNIDELLKTLNETYHRLRQSGIDEELFDVISGFEALKHLACKSGNRTLFTHLQDLE